MRPNFLPSLFLPLLLATFALTACSSREDASGTVPPISLTTLEGKTYRFAAEDKQVTLVVFWATWCKPCLIEIPDLMALHERYGDRDFRVVSINIDDPEGQKMARIYQEYNINYPMLMDDGTSEEKFGGLRALPTSFLIGRDGRLKQKLEGVHPVQKIEDAIRAEL
jgi:thiol-disulfide isomerase/thioredoxin